MGPGGEVDVRRLARLARLAITEDEAVSLAARCAEITRSFAALRDHATDLPEPPAVGPGALRPDVESAAGSTEIERIRAVVPALDAATGAVKVPRGLP